MAPSQLTKPLQPAKLTARNQLMPARRRRALKQVMPARPTAAQKAAPSQLTALTQRTAPSQLTAPNQPTLPNQLLPLSQAQALQLPQQRRRRWRQPTKRRRFRRGISACILLSCQAITLVKSGPGSGEVGFKPRPTIGRLGRCASRKTRRRLMATTWMCR